jgi:hypothetical protein
VSDSVRRTTPLIRATILGTVLQLIMVITGHYVIAVKDWFPIGGVGISTVAGLLSALWARATATGSAVRAGAIAGGASALIGVAVSCALKDVTPIILLIGTVSSSVGGMLGGLVGKFLNKSAA